MGGPRLAPGLRLAAFDSAVAATVLPPSVPIASSPSGSEISTASPICRSPARRKGSRARRNVLGLPTKYADLTLDGQARLEIRTDRVREERCSPALSLDPNSGCRGGFKAPSLDNQVNIRSSGLLGQRVHVNVDFDTERDYSSNNNVQIYYEGLEDEIVRRVDVGTVVFQPPPSRFITAAVPANNFGVNATFEVGPVPAPDAGGHPEGQRGLRADVHGRPDDQSGAGPPGARPRLRERPILLGGRSGQPAGLPGARHPQAITGRPLAHLPAERRCGSTATAPPAARAGSTRIWAASRRWRAAATAPSSSARSAGSC